MKKILFLFGLILIFSCAAPAPKKKAVKAEPITVDRSFGQVVKDDQGVPILRVTVEYLGQEPKGEFLYKINWQKNEFDFYNWTFENLTDSPITFIKQKRYSKYPKEWGLYMRDSKTGETSFKKVPDVFYKDFRENPLWEDNVLKPHSTFVKRNTFIGAGETENIRYYQFFVEYKGKEYDFTIYKVQSMSKDQ